MNIDFTFFLTNILLGIGLAMDALAVAMANGMNEPCMKPRKALGIAGIFGVFQAAMPLIGWVCVHTILTIFEGFEKFIPWIALALLSYIGIGMLVKGIRRQCEEECTGVGIGALMLQGVATSIDALSVGFTIADYKLPEALLAVGLIMAVTFIICLAGVYVGKRVGTRLSNSASIFGGSILIIIGLEIFISSFF